MLRVGAVVALLALAACGSTGMDRARSILDDDGRFDTATEASAAFGEIGDVLLAVADPCDPDVNCEALRSATAYAVVLGTAVARCTAPGRHDARQKLRSFLEAVAGAAVGDPVPDSPGLPDCR